MNLKSLLIGSAAALVAAPAFAADVIIAEPEPVEYVEVCDVAGAGYFYIPGSRTCLKIGGLVRHQLDFSQGLVTRTRADGTTFLDTDFQDGYVSLVRGELTVDTFTETELGDLTGRVKLRANDFNQNDLGIAPNLQTGEIDQEGAALNGSAFLQEATIGLGGLLLGLTDSLYDGGINGEFDSLGGTRVHTIRYTADLGAFSASIGAELERNDRSNNDFVPNITGKISGDLGAFSVDLFAGYDDGDDVILDTVIINGQAVNVDLDDEFSLKARVGADFGPAELQAAATYNSGENNFDNGYEYSFAASAKFGLGEKAAVTFGGQMLFDRLDTGFVVVNNQIDRFNSNGLDEWRVGAVVDYEIVDGFDVKLAANYRNRDEFVAVLNDGALVQGVDDEGVFDGFIRFDRSF